MSKISNLVSANLILEGKAKLKQPTLKWWCFEKMPCIKQKRIIYRCIFLVIKNDLTNSLVSYFSSNCNRFSLIDPHPLASLSDDRCQSEGGPPGARMPRGCGSQQNSLLPTDDHRVCMRVYTHAADPHFFTLVIITSTLLWSEIVKGQWGTHNKDLFPIHQNPPINWVENGGLREKSGEIR